jgi:hypothetical protein
MAYVQTTKLYLSLLFTGRNLYQCSEPNGDGVLFARVQPVSLLRSRLSRLVLDVIPGRFSSSLPPLFASGRFAAFLSLAR